MADRALESIEVDGFTSIRSARVDLGRLNVLVGANGAGKSNFIRVFEMLGRIADQELGLFVGLNGGASALLNATSEDQRIRLVLRSSGSRYLASLVAAANDELIFSDERIGTGLRADSFEGGHRETRLDQETAEILRGCRVFHFHDTSRTAPVKKMVSTADNIALRNDAGNLAAVLSALQENEEPAYRRIVGAVRLVAPFFRDFVLQPEKGDRIRLRWRQNDSDAVFSAEQMSDGTLRFICLATLLLHPNLPSLVVLDEPELGLHPYAIVQLAGLLRQASARSQVLIATQSVTLMNQFDIDDLIVVERVDGASAFNRPDQEKLREWLDEYSLGELWEKNLIGGRPGSSS